MRGHWFTAAAAAGGLGLAYAAGVEVRNFVVRQVNVACLPPGHAPIRVLHFSDLHLVPSQDKKIEWIRSLASWAPDLAMRQEIERWFIWLTSPAEICARAIRWLVMVAKSSSS